MAKKGLLKDIGNNEMILPITRGELILDSSGKQAFRSSEFLATPESHGLLSAEDKAKLINFGGIIEYNPGNIYLSPTWNSSGLILNESNGFSTGVYIIKISIDNLLFSGIASVYVGRINTSDEIVLHMSGYSDSSIRIYAKIASNNSDYGELFLASNNTRSEVTNLSITMQKLL